MGGGVSNEIRKTGIDDIIADISCGSHLCHFYRIKEDLINIIVPYFKAGLENNEFCMWITSEPLKAKEAKAALNKELRDLDDYIKKGQIEILDCEGWYTKFGKFDAEALLEGWFRKEKEALEKGFAGLRVAGNTSWLAKQDWGNFAEYEAILNSAIGKYKIAAICSYSLSKCRAQEIIDVVCNHQVAIIREDDEWISIESLERKKTDEFVKRKLEFERTISDISSRFINLSDYDSAINVSLADMGRLSGASRSYLFLFNEDGKTMDNTNEWCDEAVSPQINNLKNLPCEMFPWWMNKLQRGEIIHIEDVSKLTMEAKSEKEILEQQDIKSLLVLPLSIGNKISGFIGFDNVFKTEEWNEENLSLLRIISKIIGDALKYKRQEESLKQLELMLEEQRLSLEQKNLALKEMIEHIERTKNRIKEDISINIDETIMPIMEKLKIKIKGASPKYIELLQYHLKELASSFSRKITRKSAKLTSREIEICNMIKGGLSSKDISKLLNVSRQTIEKHRKNIRKKIGLSNKKVNLTSYLQRI